MISLYTTPVVRQIWDRIQLTKGMVDWACRGFLAPVPQKIKCKVLSFYAKPSKVETWIETGTFIGETSEYLSLRYQKVWSIEPSKECLNIARKRTKHIKNLTLIEGISEEKLAPILELIDDKVALWLDGHFSAGITYKGERNCPLKIELGIISKFAKKKNNVMIFIDDIYDYWIDPKAYPELDYYVSWAKENEFQWRIEHGIMILWKDKEG